MRVDILAPGRQQTIPDDYPDRVRRLRVEHELTQERLAELLGVSFATVNRWENAQAQPSPLAWEKFLRAEALGPHALQDELSGGRSAEPRSGYTAIGSGPLLDFSAEAERVRAVAEAERLTYGHLFNPAFASEISRVDPLPHQRIAVYERMLPQTRLRFLLADDAGAGKTIMTGLYVRQMLARRLLRRVLIVPPAGLVGNWKSEMRTLFSLPFQVASGSDARDGNPFIGPDSDLLIVSVDTLAGDRTFSRLHEPEVEPYDLVVFDEAHKLSAYREPDHTVRKTERYRLAEAIAGARTRGDHRWHLDWGARHLLLLTATPHMGKDYPYYCLWRLLEPEVLATIEAFNTYPEAKRRRHLIRRTKEEMVKFDGSPIYPMRVSDTLTYQLTQGEVSEQALYNRATKYLKTCYNKAAILNSSAAHFARSIFQRRLASSTYALLRSLERRLEKVKGLADQVETGQLTRKQLENMAKNAPRVRDLFESTTADEEQAEDGREQNEVEEDKALGVVIAGTADELRTERDTVAELVELARQVYERGEESKFARLREVLGDPKYRDEKLIIFTEHRDTLDFLVGRLESIGFTGQIAHIHGGMHYREREEQMEFFRKPASEGGAQYLVATDAAGEGINLQFCWLMVNYDIPWNPARLEQRMGRIHRYGQPHDPVVILNLVAANTREGRVIKTLLEKMERIRKELGSDKVFDVVGRTLKDVSIKDYMDRLAAGEEEETVAQDADRHFSRDKVEEVEREREAVYGEGGEVVPELRRLRNELKDEQYVRLLPGYVRQFVERAAPLLDLDVEGDPQDTFSLRPLAQGALDPLWSVLEDYSPEKRDRLTVRKPKPREDCIWLRPGEPLFDRLRGLVLGRFQEDALRGAPFTDPTADRPYIFHLALITVRRGGDPDTPGLEHPEVLESRLVGLRHEEGGAVQQCPVEHLLMLKGHDGVPIAVRQFAKTATRSREEARAFTAESVARAAVEDHRRELKEKLSEREDFIRRGFDYQEAELANTRADLAKKAREGNAAAAARLDYVKQRQGELSRRRQEALERVRREPELVTAGRVEFVAHALVVPTTSPEEKVRHDAEVERIAMQVAIGHEKTFGATVYDVSVPEGARRADLNDWPGFDLLSERPDGSRLAIEVKGRAQVGEIELSENEWAKACNLRDDYWLYVVYHCASSGPQLHRVRDPFGALVARAKGGVVIEESEVIRAAENITE